MKAKQITYKLQIEVDVSGEELLDYCDGDLISISPQMAINIARDKIQNGKGNVGMRHFVKREVRNTLTLEKDKDVQSNPGEEK